MSVTDIFGDFVIKIHRTIITPENLDDLVIQLPKNFLHSQIEVIAFALEPEQAEGKTYSNDDTTKFYKDNSVDFRKVEKWKREDLYE